MTKMHYIVKASSNYHVRNDDDNDRLVEYKMIKHIDDIITIAEQQNPQMKTNYIFNPSL
jgi:sporulation protein YlmC with PRC-barrel domain